jgi:hypothetical protein
MVGVTLDFEPGTINVPGTEAHFDNLADILPDDVLEPVGNEMVQNYIDYKSSRKDWERGYTEGLDLLGFKYENRTEPFQGASGATHPVLAEAVTQFQAQAYKELLPADGPVRTQVIGIKNPQTEQQATRVKDFMNYLIYGIKCKSMKQSLILCYFIYHLQDLHLKKFIMMFHLEEQYQSLYLQMN